MCIVIIGGNECMERAYAQACNQFGCSAKIFTRRHKDLQHVFGCPDLCILFTSTVSHNMVKIASAEARKRHIPLARSPWISFGSDMLLFHPDAAVRQARRAACGIAQDAFVILYAGKINKIKGLDLFAQAIRQRFDAKREVCIVLVGSTEGAQGAQLEQALAESENRVLRFPTQKYTDLPPFYQMADLAVFPRQCSLSFFDVQACGLPVVFEDNNINVERSAAGNARVFPADDAAGLRTALEAFIAMEPAQFAVWRENAVAYIRRAYDYEEKARAYIPYLEAQARAKGRL